MRFAKYIFYTLLLFFVIAIVVGLFLPGKTRVERTIVIDAAPQTVFSLVSDFKEISRWSPWTQNNPDMAFEYSGDEALGSVMSWQGEGSAGSQEIVAVEPGSRIEIALESKDIETGKTRKATSTFIVEPVEDYTGVVWQFETIHGLNLVQRYAGLHLEDTLGQTYERGLNNLKNLAESLPEQSSPGQSSPDQSAPDIVTQEISYSVGDTNLTGYLAMPRNAQDLPGVLVVHEWWGHNDYVRDRAEMLAQLGYVAFALDMYGDGKVAEHPADAKKFMMELVNQQDVAKARFEAALAVLKSQPQAHPNKTAAIGYCFGGAVVLSMARAGADLDGVVSFHGALGNLTPVAEDVKADFLVLHGGADPLVTDEQVQAFKDSMEAAGVDYNFVEYDDAKHAFTNPAATALGEKFDMPLEYNAEADAESWQRMQEFLAEIFK